MTVARLRETRAAWSGGYAAGQPWNMSDPHAIPPPGSRMPQRAGVLITPHTVLQVDTVMTALRVISNAIISLGDLRAFRWVTDPGTGLPYKQWQPSQPEVLASTFGEQFQYVGRRQTVLSMLLWGEAWWLILDRGRLAYPTAVEVLNPVLLTIETDRVTGAKTFWYGHANERVQLDPQNLIHIPHMSLPASDRGLSTIEYGSVTFALALAAMDWAANFFSQGASPSFLLASDQKLGQETVERIADKFAVDHAGLRNAHLPLIVDQGMKAQKLGANPDELKFTDTLNQARTTIAAYFGLPSHLIGGVADRGMVWGRTYEEVSQQMTDFTFSGLIVPLEEAHSRLLPAGVQAGFDDSLIRPEALNLAAEITALRQTQAASINDVRVRKLRWKPVDNPVADDPLNPLASNTSPDQTLAQQAQQSSTQDDHQDNMEDQ